MMDFSPYLGEIRQNSSLLGHSGPWTEGELSSLAPRLSIDSQLDI